MRCGKEALLLALLLATQASPLQEAESTLEGAFTSYLGHVEALTAQLHLTNPEPLPESTRLLLVEQLSQLLTSLRPLVSLEGPSRAEDDLARSSSLRFQVDGSGNIVGGRECRCLPEGADEMDRNATVVLVPGSTDQVDCEQSEWRPEGGCTVACGGGEQQLARTVLLQPQLGGQPCGPGNKTMPCNEQACGPSRAVLTGGVGFSSNHLSSSESHPPFAEGCSVPPLPSPRNGHTTFITTGGQVATCGGEDSSSIWLSSCLLLTSGGWQEGVLGDLPGRRNNHAAVTLDAGTYLIGGNAYGWPAFSTSDFLAAGALAWTRGPELPREMHTPCAARISPTSFMAIYGTSVLEFSTTTGPTSSSGWRPGSTWPRLRAKRESSPGCAVLGNSLVVAGGWGGRYTRRSTEVIDLQSGTIAWGPSMTSPRSSFHLLVLPHPEPRILALGGMSQINLNSVEELVGSTTEELVGGSWRQVEFLRGVRHDYGAVVVEEDTIC